jgi:hypothetical protein
MTTLTLMIAVWGLVVLAFIALMFYRAHLEQHETDQLFLNENEPSYVHKEQDDILRRMKILLPICKGVGGAAALLTFVIIGTWVMQTLSTAHLL